MSSKRMRLGLLAVLVAVSGSWLMLAAQEGAGLPADLARVPDRAEVIATFRPADLWNNSTGKAVRGGLGKDTALLEKGLAGVLGLSPAEIERVTLVVRDVGPSTDALYFVRPTKPFEAKALLARLIPDGKEEKYAGKSLFASDNRAAVVLGEQAYVIGSKGDIQTFLDGDRGKAATPATGLLEKAAGKHALVLAIQPVTLAKIDPATAPPETAAYLALLKMKNLTAVLDVGKDVEAMLTMEFPGAAEAKEGLKSVEAARTLAGQAIDQTIKQLSSEKAMVVPTGLLEKLKSSLKSAKLVCKDSQVSGTMMLTLDPVSTTTALQGLTEKMRSASRRMRSTNNLKQIGLAMHNYHDLHNGFPPAALYNDDGKPTLSWRVQILPFIDQNDLYKEFKLDEAWDSPHNKKLLAKMPSVYQSPDGKAPANHTFYKVFVGKGAAFEGKRGLKITDFTDGTSNTILAVETEKAVPWTKPDDQIYEPGKAVPKLGGVYPGGFLVTMADGSVRFISARISADTLRAAITRNGGEVLGPDF